MTESVLSWQDVENLGYTPDSVMRCISNYLALVAQFKKLQTENTEYVLANREMYEDVVYAEVVRETFNDLYREIPLAPEKVYEQINHKWRVRMKNGIKG